MPTKNTKLYSLILLLADIFVLMAVFTLAYIVRVQIDNRPLVANIYAVDFLISSIIIVAAWVAIFASFGLYSAGTYNRRLVEWSKLALGSFIGILLVIGWEYITEEHIFPARLVMVYVLFGSFAVLILEREILRVVRGLMFRFGRGIRRVLIIGNSDATRDIAMNMSDTRRSGYKIVAIAGPAKVVPKSLSLHHFSSVESALKEIKKLRVSTIIQTDLYDSEERNQKILNAAQINHISYSFIPGEPEFYAGKNTVDVFLGYPMITVSETPLIGWGAIAKGVFDRFAALILVVVLSPLFLLLIVLQKIFNPGPIFYTHKRLSRFSQPIGLVKFRSMKDRPTAHLNAAEEFRQMGREDLALEYERDHKVENDPRVTRFGQFLRDTSLDELPQIFSVLKGDLSLVGPRPIMPSEAKFSPVKTALLHSVKSGVTGLWQVSGRNELSFEERIELELYYARNWTFWLDIKILLKTVTVVFKRTGAK